ncbi:MAG: hypothetical protein AB8B87_13795 [Granulosicoccus sp.]
MQDDILLSAAQVSRLLHDLHGPVSTAGGFSSELKEAVDALTHAIEHTEPALSEKSHEHLSKIINEDIIVCTDLLLVSVEKLHSCVKEFDERLHVK